MENINNIINNIKAEANKKIIDAVWSRVDQINNALDDAYGSALSLRYGTALNCAAEAVDAYMELVALCKETTQQPLREHLRDALGSVNWEKFELPADMMAAIKKASNEAANPGFNITFTRTPVGYMPFIAEDPVEEIGRFCNKARTNRMQRSLASDIFGVDYNSKFPTRDRLDVPDGYDDTPHIRDPR